MDLLVPRRVAKYPTGLGDPEVTHLAADNGIPILLASGSVGKTVVAETEVGRHPRFQLSHEFRNIEDGFW